MSRFQCNLIIIGAVLLIVFVPVLRNDWIQFQNNIDTVMLHSRLKDPEELKGAFFGVVVVRSLTLLVPAILLIFAGVTMHIMDNKVSP